MLALRARVRAMQCEGLGGCKQVRIQDVEAGVLPEYKCRITKKFKAGGHTVTMAGDGVNDATALAQADTGIAMGTGIEVAIQSAGVTLVKSDLVGVVRAALLVAQPCATFGKPLSSHSHYHWNSDSRRSSLFRVRDIAELDGSRFGNVAGFRVRHRKRASTPKPVFINVSYQP